MMTKAISTMPHLYYRTVWISDVHLGYRGCKAEYLLHFLKAVRCDTLYLVGDIIDMWSMKKGFYWPQIHNDVIRTILGKAKHGTRIIYVPGNHDETIRDYQGMRFGEVEIHQEFVHETAQGKKMLILHGDEFDSVIQCGKLLSWVGAFGYDLLLYLNRIIHSTRRRFGFEYWSLSTFLKKRMRNAVKHIRKFEHAAVHEAKRRGMDGVVCGHIHHAEIKQIDSLCYCNTGDWVETCSALVESRQGTLELLHWSERQESLKTYLPASDENVHKAA